MAPLPKKKHSRSRTRRKRAHRGLTQINLIKCPACPEKTLPHRACSSCGHYRGRYIGGITSRSQSSSNSTTES